VYRECVRFDDIPHSSALFLDFLHHPEKLDPFVSREVSPQTIKAAAAGYDPARRAAVADAVERQNTGWGAGDAARKSLQRLRAGAMAVVSGQQVNLFGGPAYALYKALTAIKMAEELSRAGHDCVPMFWLASEDHDLAEIDHVLLPRPEAAEMETLRVGGRGTEGAPVGRIEVDASINGVLDRIAESLGKSDALEAMREAYALSSAGRQTFASGYARLFTKWFAEFGLLLIDPLDAELHRIAQPVLSAVVERSAELNGAVMERGRKLEAAGYHQQVKATAATSFLFALQDDKRIAVRRNGSGNFAIGERKLTAAELQAEVAREPERFSPNALLRTSVQNFLLPSVLYAAGPAEIAYLAQAAPLEEALVGRATPLMHRLSATIVEPRWKKLLDKYDLKVGDAFHGREHLRELIAMRRLPRAIDDKLAAASTELDKHLQTLREELLVLDPTLARSEARANKKILHQMSQLRARAARALLRRNEELGRHADQLSTALYPEKGLQERAFPAFYFMAKHGDGFLREVMHNVQRDCVDHQVLFV
jgi:bacillithiol biosynthesis cysteine-adding enzyme BshC